MPKAMSGWAKYSPIISKRTVDRFVHDIRKRVIAEEAITLFVFNSGKDSYQSSFMYRDGCFTSS